jgi:hypothetical protein
MKVVVVLAVGCVRYSGGQLASANQEWIVTAGLKA